MAQASGLPHTGEQFNLDAQPHSVRRSLKPSLLRKFIEMKSWGTSYGIFSIISFVSSYHIFYLLSYTFYLINRAWGRQDGTSLLPFPFLIIPFQSLNELTSLITYLCLNSFIHGMTLALSNIPAAPH